MGRTRSILLVLLSLAGSAGRALGWESENDGNALRPGAYVSENCEQNPPDDAGNVTYQRRQLTVTDSGSSFQGTIYWAPDCSDESKLFSVRGDTTSRVLGPANAVPDALGVEVTFLNRFMTPYTDTFVGIFDQAGCGSGNWEAGVEQDVGGGQCLFFRPIADCAYDYDILKVDGDRIYTGQRPADNDMCTLDRQPTALNPEALVRVACE